MQLQALRELLLDDRAAWRLLQRVRTSCGQLCGQGPAEATCRWVQALYELLPDDEAAALMRERNKPWAVIRKMTRLAKECGSTVPAHVRRQLELYISGEISCTLSSSVPASERHAARAAQRIWST